MTVDEIRTLFEYNAWANQRTLEACAPLTDEQFTRALGSSFASLRDTLFHILGAEWIWLERWRGGSPRALLPAAEFPTLAAVGERWRVVEREMRSYLAGLTDEALTRPLTYVNLKGDTWTYPLGQTMYHVTNHATYHRGQITTLLRQLGAPAVATDYLVLLDGGAGARRR